MAILDLQKREAEAGRVRFGNKVGNRPNRLDHPLLTSPDKSLIEAVAAAYGGKVEPWPGDPDQWMTEAPELSVLVPVSLEPVSQFWEQWSGGGCMRRCDGFQDVINDAPCDCAKDDTRKCKPTSRFVVLLPETGDARWRVETKSLHAALDLPEQLEAATGDKTGECIPGVLRVEQRKGKKGKVPVPVVKLDKVEKPAAVEPGITEQTPPPVATISQAQIGRLMAVAREHDVSTEDLKLVVLSEAGVKSRKDIPVAKYEDVIKAIESVSGELVKRERQVEP